MPVLENLWSSLSKTTVRPEPFRILDEQAEALREATDGILYGELEESPLPSGKEVCCDFYVAAVEKNYRYLLFSSTISINADYPVRIDNTIAGTLTNIPDEAAYKRHLSLIFHAPATVSLLNRIMAFAKETEADDADEEIELQSTGT